MWNLRTLTALLVASVAGLFAGMFALRLMGQPTPLG